MIRVVAFVFVLLNFLSGNIHAQKLTPDSKIDSIYVSYLDWNLKTRGRLSCEDVRDYNNGRNAIFTVKDSSHIEDLINSMSIVNLKLISKMENSDTRMVLDFYSEGERVKEVCLNFNRALFIDGNLYRGRTLYNLVDEYIPPTKAPHDK